MNELQIKSIQCFLFYMTKTIKGNQQDSTRLLSAGDGVCSEIQMSDASAYIDLRIVSWKQR